MSCVDLWLYNFGCEIHLELNLRVFLMDDPSRVVLLIVLKVLGRVEPPHCNGIE